MRSTVNPVVFHALHSHVHHEPHPVDASPIQNPGGDVAAPALATWRAGLAQTSPTWPVSSPHPGPPRPGLGPVKVDH
jgi:hypothetical protein